MIEPEIMKKTEKNYEDEKLKCKKIKKICLDIVDSFSESCEMKKMEFFVYKILNFQELIGLENDIDIVANMNNKI